MAADVLSITLSRKTAPWPEQNLSSAHKKQPVREYLDNFYDKGVDGQTTFAV
ncbi:hypothetical protein LU631_23625 [Erwinia tracheiphila]|nr:hypothetical protein [Erwinia tracheiphila]UIA87623.1 hypothetical protein LU631_23625 [Erwinia tracheiphila]UIA95987.1 hypothetical protein LU633_22065 [Erwinia tracheiphila]